MNDSNYLSKKDMIIVSLLESGCCTIEHIMNCFDFSYSYSRRLLNQHVKNNHLIVVEKPDIILGNAYFLTKKGKEQIENECLVDFYETTLTGELIEKYSNIIQTDKNKIKSELAHRVSVADFYYILLKQLGYERFSWEIESELYDETKVVGRTDATFSIGNTFYNLEIDTGSVSRYKLINKFNNYAVTNKSSLSFPCLLISTSFTYNLPRIIDINNKKHNTLIMEIEQLEENRRLINKKRMIIEKEKIYNSYHEEKYIKLSYEQLNQNYNKLLNFFEIVEQYQLSLKKSDLNRITNDINLIQDIKTSHEIANTSGIDELNIKYDNIINLINEKEKEAEIIKHDFIKTVVNKKFKSRYNSIKSIILKSNEFLPLLYKGLDMIIEPHEDMLEYINEQCDTKMLLKDYLSKLLSEYIKYYNGAAVTIENNKCIYNAIKYPLHISRAITQHHYPDNAFSYVIGVEDISNNNIGAIERVKELFLIMNKVINTRLFLIIICPNYEYFNELFDWIDVRNYNNRLAFIFCKNIRNSLSNNVHEEAVNIKDFNIDVDYVTDKGTVKTDLNFINNFLDREVVS